MQIDSSTSIKVSFVIPAYNVSYYLKQCVDSILSQTYSNTEIIIVNDGSTDRTAEIANELAKCDSRIKVIHQTNGGLSNARNTGLGLVSGEWVVFLDGDDFWRDSSALALLVSEIRRTPKCDFIGFNCSYFYPTTGKYELWVNYEKSLSACHSGKDCIATLVKSGTFPMSACLKIIRTSFLRDNNISFIQGIYSEDIPWFIKLITTAESVRFINHYVYAYRKDVPGSISTTFATQKFNDLFMIVEQGVEETGPTDTSLMSFWAYELCILLGLITFFEKTDKRLMYNKLKKYSFLLNYTENPKVKRVCKLKRILGLRLTTILLGLFIRSKVKQ